MTLTGPGRVGKTRLALQVAGQLAPRFSDNEGRLALTDPVSSHLPGLPGWARRVTIAHLMHHTSGIGDYWGAARRARGAGERSCQPSRDHSDCRPREEARIRARQPLGVLQFQLCASR